MKLSIIVPVYNMASDGKLEYCLESIMNQTIRDYEVIAVDDDSTDESMEILNQYQSRYPNQFIAIHSPENRKQGGAKNIGLKKAKGEWVGFVDSDDWIAPDMYEKLLEKAEETGADVVGCDYQLVSSHTMELGETVINNFQQQTGTLDHEKYASLIKQPGSMVIKIYKRDMILANELFFPEHIFYEDNCMGSLWMLFCKNFQRVEEPLYYYYQHGGSTVHKTTAERCQNRITSMNKLIADCKKFGFYEEYKKELEFRYVEIGFVNTLYSYLLGVKPRKIKFLKEMINHLNTHFPEFASNAEYQKKIHPEQKKQIQSLIKNPTMFLIYFILLSYYRKLRNHRKEKVKS